MTALRVRDPRCVVPGCDSTEGLEVDHIPEWEQTHHTTLDELARECAFHHDQRTYQGATLTGGPGHWHWTPPPPGPFDDPPRPGPFDQPRPSLPEEPPGPGLPDEPPNPPSFQDTS
ncbi:MAG TPA: HNH endonuclease signature motif containing protein [Acidimicrobiales bacterium]|nr:HNH endonuclease signature motif containing protein [Acidimicrobiales bacterium]